MKPIVSILIGIYFVLLWLLNNNWSFDIWIAYIFWVKGLGWVNFSFIKVFVEELLAFPNFLHLTYASELKSFLLDKWYFISFEMIQLSIIFWFYFLFSIIVAFATEFFFFKRDKIYLIWFVIFFYLLLMFLN